MATAGLLTDHCRVTQRASAAAAHPNRTDSPHISCGHGFAERSGASVWTRIERAKKSTRHGSGTEGAAQRGRNGGRLNQVRRSYRRGGRAGPGGRGVPPRAWMEPAPGLEVPTPRALGPSWEARPRPATGRTPPPQHRIKYSAGGRGRDRWAPPRPENPPGRRNKIIGGRRGGSGPPHSGIK